MSGAQSRAVLAGAVLAALVLALAGPDPAEAAAHLRLAASAADPTAPLVAVLALLAWALTGWLALGVSLTLLVRAPGQVGRAAAGLTRRIVPPPVRRLLVTALGATAVAGTLLASPAAAVPATGPGPVGAAAVPSPAPGDDVFDLDWPEVATDAGPSGVPPPPADGPPPTAADAVVVRPGDTLWGLAEQALVQHAAAAAPGAPAAAPTAAQVACAWPSWWSANREVVGDDPDLLLPGTVLRLPPADPPH